MYQSFQHTDFIEETIERPLPPAEQSFDQVNELEVKKPGISESDGGNKRIRVKELLDGTILIRENIIRQWPYVLFLTFLGVIYIGNRFHAEKMVRQINELKIEVNNLRAEQITTTSELMNISRPSEVNALVDSRGLGLKESLEPPKKIKR